MTPQSDSTFTVVGTGGVGGFFGALLHQGGLRVRFLARGKHLEALREHGLRVESGGRMFVVPPANIARSPEEAGKADVVLFCVKSYDTVTAARSLGPLLHDGTIIISLQNGVENEDIIARSIPRGTVFGGVAYVYATITEPGVVTEHGGPKKIVFGPRTASPGLLERGGEILRAVQGAGVDAECTPNIAEALWKKFLFITAVGGMTALTRLTLGEILASPETRAVLHSAMRETLAVANACGVPLGAGYIDEVFERLKKYDNSSRSSLYHDLANNRRLEIDALSGAVVRLGRRHGVPTPVHEVIVGALLPYHRRALGAMSTRQGP
ncbi:MAG TPA: 2-dehydropantoate 2-reductase [Bacteroidota bacterium]